jgi:anti-sigma factor RsiW
MSMFACRRHRESVHLLAAGVLPQLERPGLEAHLVSCPRCRRRIELAVADCEILAWTSHALVRALPTPSATMAQRWRRAIREADATARMTGGEPNPLLKAWRRLTVQDRSRAAILAASWLLILVVRVATPHPTSSLTASSPPPSPREMLHVLLQEDGHSLRIDSGREKPIHAPRTRQGQPAPPRSRLQPERVDG